MLVESRIEADVVVITPLEARVDVRVAPALLASIVDRIERGHRRLLINPQWVQCIDSSGIGALISASRRLGPDGDLKVCSLSAKVRSVFERTRLSRVIAIAE